MNRSWDLWLCMVLHLLRLRRIVPRIVVEMYGMGARGHCEKRKNVKQA